MDSCASTREKGEWEPPGGVAVAEVVPSAVMSVGRGEGGDVPGGASDAGGGAEARAEDVTRRFETPKGRPPYGIMTVEPSAALV